MAQLKFITKNAADSIYAEKYTDDFAINDVVRYIHDCKHGGAKTQGYVGGWAVDPFNAIYEMELVSALYHKRSGVRLRHWTITFQDYELQQAAYRLPNMNQYQILFQLGLEFTVYFADCYQVIFAVHLDKDVGHIHAVMNTVSYVDGKKHSGSKGDYYAYEAYAKTVAKKYGFNIYAITDNTAKNHII